MIYMGRSDGTYVAESLGAMLPYGFTADKYEVTSKLKPAGARTELCVLRCS